MTATGVETLLVVLEGLTPDLVLLRARNELADRSRLIRGRRDGLERRRDEVAELARA